MKGLKSPGLTVFVIALISAISGFLYWSDSQQMANNASSSGMKLDQVMGEQGGQGDYLEAKPGTQLRFPQDHGSHPGFQNEWWYFTASLKDKQNLERRFGVQLTLFRFAVADQVEESDNNPWLSPDIYMGHFAVTHVEEGEHLASERFSRQGPGLSGADAGDKHTPIRFWLTDWEMRSEQAAQLFPMSLKASDSEQQIAIDLFAEAVKSRILQGENGFSQKNLEGGGSYYYSYSRLKIEGQLNWQQQKIDVEGEGWFDHEWSSNSLASYQKGWDWFSLQLDDQRELMYYRFRNQDGSEGLSHLILVEADGNVRSLDSDKLEMEVLDHWQSEDGTRYPASWQLRLPTEQIDIRVTPLVADQLMDLSVSYWEGAVSVSGSHQGYGYVELAGYND